MLYPLWVRSRAEAPHGTLRLTTFQLFADTLLGPVVAAYLAQNAGMSVQVVIDERDVDMIGERLDLAVRIGSLTDSSLVVRKLAEMEGWMVASPRYLAEHGTPTHPNELAQHSNLIYRHDQEMVRLPFDDGHERLEVSLPSRFVANSIELVRQVTLRGLGIGFLPPMLAHEHLASGRLVRVLPTWSTVSLPMYAVYPSRRHLAQKVRKFVDLLVEHVTTEAVQGSPRPLRNHSPT